MSAVDEILHLIMPTREKWMEGPIDMENTATLQWIKGLAKMLDADEDKICVLKYIDENKDNANSYEEVDALREIIALLHSLEMYRSPPDNLDPEDKNWKPA
ncbi:MAG: hypothetical protein H0W78_08320 [Planctomycetes bacterium]|nr:hypothetical protein [Planctomycetota bacterium]